MGNGAEGIYTERYLGSLPEAWIGLYNIREIGASCLSHCFCFPRVTEQEFWSNRALHQRVCAFYIRRLSNVHSDRPREVVISGSSALSLLYNTS